MPAPTKVEELQVFVHLRRWDITEGELQSRVESTVASLGSDADRESALELLSEDDLPAAWELGRAFAVTGGQSETTTDALTRVFGPNPLGLIGYLHGLTESGHESAFDEFLDSARAMQLDLKARLTIAVRGPVTDRSRARVLEGLRELPVADGTYVLFGWLRNLLDNDVDALIDDWLPRVSSQQDYNALVDWFNLWLHNREAIPDSLRGRALRLILLRSQYPDVSREAWDWSRIATSLADEHGVELARLVLDLVDSGSLMIHEGQDEFEVIANCLSLHPRAVWDEIAERLGRGSWRIQMQLGGPLLNVVPIEIIEAWVGDDVRRAQLVASIAPVGIEEPTPIARFLLGRFGEDQKVASGLWAQFISGWWTGPESQHIAGQIEQLNRWRQRPEEPLGVRTWARDMVQDLEVRRQAALEREAETDL